MPTLPAGAPCAPARLARLTRRSGGLGVVLAAAFVAASLLRPGAATNGAVAATPTAVQVALAPHPVATQPPQAPARPSTIATPVPPTPTPAPFIREHPARSAPAPLPTLRPSPTALPPMQPTPTHPAIVPPRQPVLPLRGMGYNPTYATASAPDELRAARVWRDIRLMHEAGVNLVLGWDGDVFDETLIAAADANDVSVLLPFDLKPSYNYADPTTREQLTQAVLAWVERYRDKPAVLMWAIGNEVTIEMTDAEKRAFADYYVELFQQVRKADPTRAVILREAEDVFAPYLADAFQRHGFDQGPTGAVRAPEGFVYGVNFYTERVGPALADWLENTNLDAKLFVSEYAPAGAGHAARPAGFARMYQEIAAAGPRVLGSAPYTWTAAGPEAVDAYFGLVDADGHPVDGTLAQIARLYGVDPPAWTIDGQSQAQAAEAAELPRLIDQAVAVAEKRTGESAPAVAEVAQDARAAAQAPAGGSADRQREVTQLAALARQLADVREGEQSLFPGMRESVPLLDGMARWSAVEPSAGDTARSFLATVLKRDLNNLGG
ncbi:MAG TPA: glycoside hydrolase family 2 TIM barrel-domain containing protein [Chloroflexota bacterium]|nr:glycoside hydrolase family 2 TIM barrel-domain containing protein [Chloroflexota bacterium]